MNDNDFLQAFEQGKLSHFPHPAHLRMAWLYLHRDGWENGVRQIRAGIQRFAHLHGAAQKYHETITVFWAYMVYDAIRRPPDVADSTTFVDEHPGLLDSKLIMQFYSAELLYSEAARQSWVEPDLKPLPSFPGDESNTP